MRYQLSDDGDDSVHLRLYDGASHNLLGTLCNSYCPSTRYHWRFVRDHPLRGQAPQISVRGHDGPGPVATANYDPPAVRRTGCLCNHRTRSCYGAGKRTWRGISDCLGIGRWSLVVGKNQNAWSSVTDKT